MTVKNTDSAATLTITRPDDWHVHLRDGDQLKDTVRDISRYMGRAIIMPNLMPPATCTDTALAYRERIMAAGPQGNFEPLMVLYLTDKTTPDEIIKAKATGKIVAAKLYPAGATTNSDSGVTSIKNIYPVLAAMQDVGMLLLIHGEVTDSSIDIFDREKIFIETILGDVVTDFPELKIVLEHITTKDAVEFVTNAPDNVAATITAHHLLYNRNHMLAGGIRPHYYCLPILKRNIHQHALMAAAVSGNKKFFLGTDSAPHYKDKKEAACGCAGAYTAHAAIELYAEAFEGAGKLDKLEGFASFFGPDFYGLARNKDTITLERSPWQVPASYTLGDSQVVPIKAEDTIDWQVK
ncbi:MULTISPECIES: dihydroorotase [Pseudoalteromonas]|uniref:Dihydroorotase n=2 Tax=Pseudoalteromonas nigrifaciens TaxID=28109 RepID=A0AAC9XXG9_9GAMM|nr:MULTISPECIES: dihydroorotase [Pseudoalteromonas]ASM53613.1 dihydroorotase [Pseudoalteromonas nigrifaciens]MBB1371662.1 dihydroorotase [Pseudoalteromonas sp. SR45-4]MBB1404188.1 dihydroorotase [Pseudoalteromonas sp. SG44-5]MBE0420828.1 dihydroorotase [Pseudoalteromonas nigrifaciens]MBH0094124.1 dihydroorotase [Pseudoalteromonas sp. SCQQ13]|tara:strand:+ start:4934 stop:5986 length:1053 start_codon:yes stop_codon:yes gene_type:complete